MRLNLTADELLATTRAVRKRLDFDRPVEPSVLKECLESAVQAPTGSNSQGWRFMVVTDVDKKAAIAELYRRAWYDYYQPMDREPRSDKGRQLKRVMSSATHLADNFERVPVWVIPCMPGRLDNLPNVMAAGAYGSIHPATWSFMLAARDHGLGTSFTTLHLTYEQQAAEILGIPFADYTQCALVTVGYTVGTDFKPASRPPVETVTYWDTWGDEADFSDPT
jgi:nitroreductase